MTSESSLSLNTRAEIYIDLSIFVTLITISFFDGFEHSQRIILLMVNYCFIIASLYAIKKKVAHLLMPLIIFQLIVVLWIFTRLVGAFWIIDHDIFFEYLQITLHGYFVLILMVILFGFSCYSWNVILSLYLQIRSDKSLKLPVASYLGNFENNLNTSSAPKMKNNKSLELPVCDFENNFNIYPAPPQLNNV